MPLFARFYHLAPRDVWALTLEEFFLFVQDHAAYIEALSNK